MSTRRVRTGNTSAASTPSPEQIASAPSTSQPPANTVSRANSLRRGVAGIGQQPEAIRQPRSDLFWREDARLRRCQWQWQTVQPAADVRHGCAVARGQREDGMYRRGAFHEQPHGPACRTDSGVERLASGTSSGNTGRTRSPATASGSRLWRGFAIQGSRAAAPRPGRRKPVQGARGCPAPASKGPVPQAGDMCVSQREARLLTGTQRGGDRLWHQGGLDQLGQLCQPGTVGVFGQDGLSHAQRQPVPSNGCRTRHGAGRARGGSRSVAE